MPKAEGPCPLPECGADVRWLGDHVRKIHGFSITHPKIVKALEARRAAMAQAGSQTADEVTERVACPAGLCDTMLKNTESNLAQHVRTRHKMSLAKARSGVVATDRTRIDCPLGCGAVLKTRGILSQHVRKRHGTSLTELKATLPSGPRASPVPAAVRPPLNGGRSPGGPHLELVESMKVIRIDGVPGLWMPMEEVFRRA